MHNVISTVVKATVNIVGTALLLEAAVASYITTEWLGQEQVQDRSFEENGLYAGSYIEL